MVVGQDRIGKEGHQDMVILIVLPIFPPFPIPNCLPIAPPPPDMMVAKLGMFSLLHHSCCEMPKNNKIATLHAYLGEQNMIWHASLRPWFRRESWFH